MSYAKNTTVSPEKSQTEIKNTLRKYGADRFGIMEEKNQGHVMFEYNGLLIQMTVIFPNKEDFSKTESGKKRIDSAIDTAYEQGIKQRWRALLLAIKAKLEAVECGISTIEQEFLAFVMMPDGRNISDHLIPELNKIVLTGNMPKMLTAGRI